jgi:hypothetical protein
MRKQYYFLPSKNGFYAWDIDRLVQLSTGLPVIDIKLSNIQELDEQFTENGKALTYRSVAAHLNLVHDADLKYPIILSKSGRVMDGMHRVIKALMLGHETIKAVQFNEDLKPDFVDVQEDDLPYD